MNMQRYEAQVRATLPPPGDDPISHLIHTVAAFAEQPDDEMAIMATGNIYGYGVRTGLTWGDLRALAEMAVNDE